MKGNNPESKAAIKEVFNHSGSDSDHENEHDEKRRLNSDESDHFDYETLIKSDDDALQDEKTSSCWSGFTSCLSTFFCCDDSDEGEAAQQTNSERLSTQRYWNHK